MSGYSVWKLFIRDVSHADPNATVVVIFNGPSGWSRRSLMRARAIASFAAISRTVAWKSSPCSVSTTPLVWR